MINASLDLILTVRWKTMTNGKFLLAALCGVLGLVSINAAQAGVLTFTKSTTATTVDVGDTINYDMGIGCIDAGDGLGCGDLIVIDDLDAAQLENFNLSGLPASFTVTFTTAGNMDPQGNVIPAGTTRLTIERNGVAGGDTFTAVLSVRVRTDAPISSPVTNPVAGGTLNATTTGPGGGSNVNPPGVSVNVNTPTPQWTLEKTQVEPTGDWVLGQDVVYRLRFSSDTASGNVNLADIMVVDTLAAGTQIIDADGGTIGPANVVTWDLGDRNANQGAVDRFLRVRYNAPTFSCTSATNMATAEANHFFTAMVGVPEQVGSDSLTTNCTMTTIVATNLSKTAPTASGKLLPIGPGKTGEFQVQFEATNATNTSVLASTSAPTPGAPHPGPVFVDTIPTAEIEALRARSGRWEPSGIMATLEASTDSGTTYGTTLGTVDGNANTFFNLPVGTTNVRWIFQSPWPVGFDFTTNGRIEFQHAAGFVPPGSAENCIDGYWNDGTADQTSMDCATVELEDVTAHLSLSKSMDDTTLTPGQEVTVTLRLELENESSAPLINPTLVDLLPESLEFLSWDMTSFTNIGAPDQVEPNLEVIEDYLSTGRTLLRFTWSPTPPAGSIDIGGFPGAANPWTLPVPASDAFVEIDITARVSAGTPSGGETNDMQVFSESVREFCQGSDDFDEATAMPAVDLNGNGMADDLGCSNDRAFTVLSAAVLIGAKWDIGTDGLPHVDPNLPTLVPNGLCPDRFGGYTRVPCVAQGLNGSPYDYKLELVNFGNEPLKDYILYDILPFVGDTLVSEVGSAIPRDSEWQPVLTGPVLPDPATPLATTAATVEYSLSTNPCRDEVANGPDGPWQAGICDNDWTANPGDFGNDFSLVRSFRIIAPFGDDAAGWQPGEAMQFDVDVDIPLSAAPGQISWNNFAHRATNASTGGPGSGQRLPTAEPPRVGILVPLALDYGDLPDPLVATAGDYPTLAVNGGASHIIDPDIFLGACVDNDSDGQPSAMAGGDDNDAGGVNNVMPVGNCTSGDDEDGIVPLSLFFEEGSVPSLIANVVNNTGSSATLSCWADYNGNGVLELAERGMVAAPASGPVLVPMPVVPAGTVTATGGPGGDLFVRCRLSTDTAAQNPDDGGTSNPAADGEVEDYRAPVYGSAFPAPPQPPQDWGDNPDALRTLAVSIGPQHGMIADLRIGACVDEEPDGQPTAGSDGDDNGAASSATFGTCASADDEDGVNPAQLAMFEGFGSVLDIDVVSTNASVLACWADYNGDNLYDSATEMGSVAVPPATNGPVQLTMPIVPVGSQTATSGTSYLRCRIANDGTEVTSAFGPASTGEVEDYQITITETGDNGDLPDTGAGTGVGNYQTLEADGGPVHTLNADGDGNAANDPFLGACVDSEGDGSPSVMADGDDTAVGAPVLGTCTGFDDEDGVTIGALILDMTATLDVVANQPCTLSAFIDWNANGSFGDANEDLFPAGQALAAGANNFVINVPAAASEGTTYARFRCTTDGKVAATGAASDGEVEDYQVQVLNAMDWGDAPDTSLDTGNGNYNTQMSDSGPRHVLGAADLYLGACVDDETDGQQSILADGDDTGAANSLTTGTCGTYNGIANNDEDGPVVEFPMLVPGQVAPTLAFNAFNATTTGVAGATLSCWIDYNVDGVFDNATERAQIAVPQNAATQMVNLTFPNVPATILEDTGGATYMRCRLSSDADAQNPTGLALDGEVEDHLVQFKPAGAIGNVVWHDEDNDGEQDAGEPGIPGVTVILKDADNAGAVITTQVTDAAGGYLFTGLPPGNYEVMVDETTVPAGFTQTSNPVNPGADFGNQSQTGPNGGYPIALGIAEENLTADFGYNINADAEVNGPPGANDPAALGDKVWIDANGNGAQDPGELGIAGVPVAILGAGPDGIFGNGDDTNDATVTNASGMYYFDNLPPGAYAVTVTTPPAGYTQTGDPDHFGTTGVNDNTTTNPVILGPGDVVLNVDFGYQPPAEQDNSLGDTVWFDSNGDGIEDAGEPGIPGVTVVLLDGLGNPLANTTTDANGSYLFDGLADGDYMVLVTDTNNVLDGLANSGDPDDNGTPADGDEDGKSTVIGLGNGNPAPVDNPDQDFGYTPVGHAPTDGLIGDTVFLDSNGNGLPDPGEGIEGVTVKLIDPATMAVIGLDVTDENGRYAFGGLDPVASYIVMVMENTLPPGLVNHADPDDNGTDNDGDEDSMSAVNLMGSGPIDLNQDFGYLPDPALSNPVGTIGTQVWTDSNADGVFDGPNGPDATPGTDDDEPGIPGVTIDLVADSNGNGSVDPGEPVIASTTTAADGSYLFQNLPVDDGTGDANYLVVVTDTAGVLLGSWHSIGPDEGDTTTDNNSQFNAHPVQLSPATPDYPLADFGYYTEKAALGNFVWFDVNDNGVQDSGEPVIPGATVTLTIGYPGGGSVTSVQLTGADGSYNFAGLLCDEDYNGDGLGQEPTYSIAVELPAGYIPGQINIGSGATPDRNDSDDHTGQSAQPTLGITDMSLLANPNNETPPATYDFNALATDFGDLPAPYATLLAANGARHIVLPTANPTMGATVDIESDGVPSTPANGDDLALSPDDEDGVTIPLLVPGTTRNVTVTYINATAGVTVLNAWLDIDGDGALNQIATNLASTGASGSFVIPVVIPQTATPGDVYGRFRFSNQAGLALTGQASDGEVEDYVARIPEVDYGDLPDVYDTLNGSGGAFHVIDDVNKLGANVDHDIDGFPGDDADGDDTEAGGGTEETGDDENGVGFNPMLPGLTTDVELMVMGSCYTSVFMDVNDDGAYDALTVAAGSAVGTPGNAPTDILLGAGTHILTLDVPANTTGAVHARVRCANQAGEANTPAGLSESGGEVEDYVLMSISNRVFLDDGTGGGVGNNGLQDGAEPGIENVLMELVQGGVVIATDSTDASGNYEFPGLEPGTYKVQVAASNFQTGQLLEGRLSSTGAGDPNANIEEGVDENGVDDADPANNAIMSADVILVLGTAPAGTDTDPNTNDTVDFGIVKVDYTDNPDSFGTSGPTGARHILDGVTFLGGGVEEDTGGSPSEGADGDDEADATDDEDGITFLTPVIQGATAKVQVKANGLPNTTVYLDAWMDFNGNGAFDGGEQIFTDEPLVLDGTGMADVMLSFPVPAGATGDLNSRFRLASATDHVTGPTGTADSGELEDYVMLMLGNRVWIDGVDNVINTGSHHFNGLYEPLGDGPLEGVLIRLLDESLNPILDGDNVPVTLLTDANGLYKFTGLPEGQYVLHIPADQFQPFGPLFELRPVVLAVEMDPNDDGDEQTGHNALNTESFNANGVFTGVVLLSAGDEPSNDGDPTNSNLSVDFAFRPDLMLVPTLNLFGLLTLAGLLGMLGLRRRRQR